MGKRMERRNQRRQLVAELYDLRARAVAVSDKVFRLYEFSYAWTDTVNAIHSIEKVLYYLDDEGDDRFLPDPRYE